MCKSRRLLELDKVRGNRTGNLCTWWQVVYVKALKRQLPAHRHQQHFDFLLTALRSCHRLLARPLEHTRARMTRRRPVAERRVETACLRPNVPTNISTTSPNQKRATNKRNQKPLLPNNQERNNQTALKPLEAQKRQQQ